MGRDTRARGYFSILGPGMDFYRVPMGGRNFEYMTGEDPYLGSQLNPAEIQGIQAQGVWACAKHYVCNDEEENRTKGIRSELGSNTQVDFISVCSLDPANAIWQYSNHGEITQGLQASYYTTPDLSGQPAVTRVDNQINFDWDIDQIPVSSNQGSFSAKWVGQIKPTITGDHVIKVRGDGGLRIILNGTTIFDNFNSPTIPPVGYGPTPAYSAKATLTAGQTKSSHSSRSVLVCLTRRSRFRT